MAFFPIPKGPASLKPPTIKPASRRTQQSLMGGGPGGATTTPGSGGMVGGTVPGSVGLPGNPNPPIVNPPIVPHPPGGPLPGMPSQPGAPQAPATPPPPGGIGGPPGAGQVPPTLAGGPPTPAPVVPPKVGSAPPITPIPPDQQLGFDAYFQTDPIWLRNHPLYQAQRNQLYSQYGWFPILNPAGQATGWRQATAGEDPYSYVNQLAKSLDKNQRNQQEAANSHGILFSSSNANALDDLSQGSQKNLFDAFNAFQQAMSGIGIQENAGLDKAYERWLAQAPPAGDGTGQPTTGGPTPPGGPPGVSTPAPPDTPMGGGKTLPTGTMPTPKAEPPPEVTRVWDPVHKRWVTRVSGSTTGGAGNGGAGGGFGTPFPNIGGRA